MFYKKLLLATTLMSMSLSSSAWDLGDGDNWIASIDSHIIPSIPQGSPVIGVVLQPTDYRGSLRLLYVGADGSANLGGRDDSSKSSNGYCPSGSIMMDNGRQGIKFQDGQDSSVGTSAYVWTIAGYRWVNTPGQINMRMYYTWQDWVMRAVPVVGMCVSVNGAL
jgi:hypothetical protein